MLSRTKPATGPGSQPVATKKQNEKKKLPKLEDLLSSRDYTGAQTLLEVNVCKMSISPLGNSVDNVIVLNHQKLDIFFLFRFLMVEK